ncbi:peptidoglycan DD-metalloendopeptidase family protein [Psychrosphaera sp. 1_MG-2023]|uniref:Peptidoglycan DD-metalloendopeptidase family protein n=1 Tax=Psychrosphaera algicola TaxID=3023714 RepID=A0ABT5FF04_9GAMM|nr:MULTISPECIES: peptidoglycan DD-metalloendopeptidase family protein [unclassified Psychrosphaera]MDC2889468.1 peptidoglycan DD-metalloendopeptidase family protein [Psychrosphaera sp. G1-22]MDO6718216.1 peptidoglycan DD-metalloendopeptidase family protein [Psychrosphaera sp. 1_MG-2023]
MTSFKNVAFGWMICVFSLLYFALPAYAEDAVSKETARLKLVQDNIKQQRLLLEQQIKKESNIETQFQAAELKVAELALNLAQTERQISATQTKIRNLDKEQSELLKQKKLQQKVLGELIKTAYLSGKHDYTKLLLNQDDPAQLERLITYYRKINDARVAQLDEIQAVFTRLTEVEEQLIAQKEQLAISKADQLNDKKQLLSSQMERKAALNKLRSNIKTDKQKLEQLQLDQERLTNAIARAKRNAERDPENLIGLYNLKRKLKWPTRGRLVRKFGQRRSGALRWKGVVIDGNLGNRVNVIADGIVLYADWLKGFGWVAVVDHGKGYMSLYGHNQALLKQAGDYVEQNEPIALVGQSGGQQSAGLYFEIRYKGETVNPARWCR